MQAEARTRTSLSDPLRVDELHFRNITIGITMRPGRCGRSMTGPDWTRDFEMDMAALQDWAPSHLIWIDDKPVDPAALVVSWKKTPVILSLTWPDLCPDQIDEGLTTHYARQLHGQGSTAFRILIVSEQGLLRSGLAAGQILALHGKSAGAAELLINSARPGAISTLKQRALLASLSAYRPAHNNRGLDMTQSSHMTNKPLEPFRISEMSHENLTMGMARLPGMEPAENANPTDLTSVMKIGKELADVLSWKATHVIWIDDVNYNIGKLTNYLQIRPAHVALTWVDGVVDPTDEKLLQFIIHLRRYHATEPARILILAKSGIPTAGLTAGIALRILGRGTDLIMRLYERALPDTSWTMITVNTLEGVDPLPVGRKAAVAAMKPLLEREMDYPRIIAAKHEASYLRHMRHTEALETIAQWWGYRNWSTFAASARQPGHAYPANDRFEREIHHALKLDSQDAYVIAEYILQSDASDQATDMWTMRAKSMIVAMVSAILSFCRAKGVPLTADILRNGICGFDTPLGFLHMLRLAAHDGLDEGAAKMILSFADTLPGMDVDAYLCGIPPSPVAREQFGFLALFATKKIGDVIDKLRSEKAERSAAQTL